jgi:hypothetical protein
VERGPAPLRQPTRPGLLDHRVREVLPPALQLPVALGQRAGGDDAVVRGEPAQVVEHHLLVGVEAGGLAAAQPHEGQLGPDLLDRHDPAGRPGRARSPRAASSQSFHPPVTRSTSAGDSDSSRFGSAGGPGRGFGDRVARATSPSSPNQAARPTPATPTATPWPGSSPLKLTAARFIAASEADLDGAALLVGRLERLARREAADAGDDVGRDGLDAVVVGQDGRRCSTAASRRCGSRCRTARPPSPRSSGSPAAAGRPRSPRRGCAGWRSVRSPPSPARRDPARRRRPRGRR